MKIDRGKSELIARIRREDRELDIRNRTLEAISALRTLLNLKQSCPHCGRTVFPAVLDKDLTHESHTQS